ncbi:MAG: hypothetical protein ACJASR_002387 [Psychroserpens sp.]
MFIVLLFLVKILNFRTKMNLLSKYYLSRKKDN